MECRHCKYYKLLDNGYHGQCIVNPEKHTLIHPYNGQCTEFEKNNEEN